MTVVPDLIRPTRIHVIAAGGAAMSAICHILGRLGHTVTGSDQLGSDAVDRLRAEGFHISIGHRPEAVHGAELVVVSTAVKLGNVELDEALRLGIPVAGRPDVMESLGALADTLAISGTHGKTTTSAMAATAAEYCGMNPSFIVGGIVNQLSTGVRWTGGHRLVVEADESDNSFLRFGADDVIVTNIEADHLDFHGSMANLEAAFDRFVTQGSGRSTVCLDDAGIRAMVNRVGSERLCTYGTDVLSDYVIDDLHTEGMTTTFSVRHLGSTLAHLSLRLPGEHNARNATSVLAALHGIGAAPDLVAEALSTFTGVGRRFEYRGTAAGITFVDDYAHLPSEVSAVVGSASKGGWGRVVAVFQPHRYTRIRDVGAGFAASFDGAAVVVITGLYAAGQAPIESITGRTVFDAVSTHLKQSGASTQLEYCETRTEVETFLGAALRDGDLCLTMNAGDLTTLPTVLINQLRSGGSGS